MRCKTLQSIHQNQHDGVLGAFQKTILVLGPNPLVSPRALRQAQSGLREGLFADSGSIHFGTGRRGAQIWATGL